MSIQIAIVGSDDAARLALVKALDKAPLDWDLRLCRSVPDEGIVVCDAGVDAPGAIVYDGSADALLKNVRNRVVPRARFVAVTGTGGGTGATSVALHLAAEFSARGHRTAALDLGTRWGLRGRLGLEPSDDPVHPVPVAGGFKVVTHLNATAGFERVVVDAPVDRVDDLEPSIPIVLVFSPTPEGARRARSVMQQRPESAWHPVANRLGPGGETTRSQIERLVGVAVTELPCCAALRDSEDEARLLARGWTRWSRAVARLASSLDA